MPKKKNLSYGSYGCYGAFIPNDKRSQLPAENRLIDRVMERILENKPHLKKVFIKMLYNELRD